MTLSEHPLLSASKRSTWLLIVTPNVFDLFLLADALSEILAQPKRVENRRMDIAACNRVPNTEKHEVAFRVKLKILLLSAQQCVLIGDAVVARVLATFLIDLVHRQRAMFHYDVIDQPRYVRSAVLIRECDLELVTFAFNALDPRVGVIVTPLR